MSTVSASSIGTPSISTSSISTPSIHVSDTSFHGVFEESINTSPTSVVEAHTSVVTHSVDWQPDHGASFWVA